MSWRRRVLIGLGGIAALGLSLWGLTWLPPAWWNPPDPADPAVDRLAQQVEAGLVEQAHLIRPDESNWSVRITDEQLNAWLSARLQKWIAHDGRVAWPREIGVVQLRARPGLLTIAAEERGGAGSRIAALRLRPSLKGGRMHLELDQVSLGWLPMPGAAGRWAAASVRDRLPRSGAQAPEVAGLLRALAGEGELVASIKLSDGRTVELLGVTLGDGEITLTCRTRPRDEK